MCETHYWQQNRMKSAQKFIDKEVIDEEGLPELIEEADAVFSRYVRMSAAINGWVKCYICDHEDKWQYAQCMHFIPRSNLFLRWDLRNCRSGCSNCNEFKGGNLLEFGKKLNEEQPGITDILFEEAHVVYKPTRDEVRKIIGEYSTKIKLLKQWSS